MVNVLSNSGHEVFSLEKYHTGRWALGRKNDVETYYADIRDYFSLEHIIQRCKPQVVCHLAAVTPVAYSYDHPQEIYESNMIGTSNVIHANLRKNHYLEQFIFTSSAETYGNQARIPTSEEMALSPISPYAISKAASEYELLYLRASYDFPVTIIRPFNIYGRTDNLHFVVERAMEQALEGKEMNLGDPSVTRDFVHVSDAVKLFEKIIEQREKSVGQIFNLCTSVGTKITELASLVKELVGFEGKVRWHTIPARPTDIERLVGDNSKTKEVLNWTPEVPLRAGLQRFLEEAHGPHAVHEMPALSQVA